MRGALAKSEMGFFRNFLEQGIPHCSPLGLIHCQRAYLEVAHLYVKYSLIW